MNTNKYGMELIADLHDCDISTFSQENLSQYFVELCDLIKMKRHGDPMFWIDHSDIPHLKGVSGIQFIETSNVVVHCIELQKSVYINIFSCKDFDAKVAEQFTKEFFKAETITSMVIDRV
jgi:S-adenosylmethionine/arginine decarboxylase-like enzyme